MKKIIFAAISLFTLATLNGQVEQQSLPEVEKVSNRRTSFNLEEIKVRWKKAALENCPGVPCIVTPPAPSFTCGTSTVTDIDGNIYNTVSIGTGATAQCWTKENLKVTKYNDGTLIPLDASGTSTGTVSETWSSQPGGARTVYANDANNLTTYGYLYNWFAVNDAKGLCPTGWHVPTDAEWTTLESYLNTVAPTGNVGGKMKSTGTTYWNTPNSGADNSSGFTALPGGYRDNYGSFNYIRYYAFFWSATKYDNFNAWYRPLYNTNGNVIRNYNDKPVGASVRCLRD